ncbi:hypothetical protein VUR80DRAFT_4694 [Thermomyces stellatus]
MPTTLIFGGSGRVAQQLTKILAAEPNATIHSVIRSDSYSPALRAIGATPLVSSIEESSTEQLTATIERTSPDAVVWSAGAGGKGPQERTVKVDHEGAVRVMDALAAANTGKPKRFVMVSAIDVRDRENRPVPSWYTKEDEEAGARGWAAIPTYFKAKLAADRELVAGNARRGLEYTIVRPGPLSDEPGQGRVRAGRIHTGGSISREDVAGVIAAVLKNKDTVGLAFDILGDGEGALGITDAVARVAEKREDTFEGYY